MTMAQRWTPEEDAIIREHYPAEGARSTALRLEGRTREAVICRARRLGVCRDGYCRQDRRLWTWREDCVLRDLYPTTPTAHIVETGVLPGRTADDIRRRASKLGVRKLTARERAERAADASAAPVAPVAHLWTAADDRVLRAAMEAHPGGVTYTQARALGWYIQAGQPRARVTAHDVAGRIGELYAQDLAETLQATA